MLDRKFIPKNLDTVKEGLKKRGVEFDVDLAINKILELDKKEKDLKKEIEMLEATKNKLGKEEAGKGRKIKEKINELKPKWNEIKDELNKALHKLPNLPLEDVEVTEKVLREWGEKPQFNFKPRDHLELGEALNIIDVKRGAKVSGARFAYLKGTAALLEFALIDLAIRTVSKEGFIPVIPPALIREGVTESLGYWDLGGHENYYYVSDNRCPRCDHAMRWGKQVFCQECKKEITQETVIEEDNVKRLKCHNCEYTTRLTSLYLIGTAEHAIAPMHGREVFEEKELPKRYIGFSSSFRREAGSYGKDTRGIFRVHQFDKIELFSFCHPEKSKEEHQLLVALEEKLWQALKIPYKVVQLAAGDMSHPVASTIDIEVWLPGQNRYREVSSASNTTDFQARRLNIRYRNSETKKLEFVHTINGTAFAIGRTLIAILENYQKKDGSIEIPKVLQKYLKFKEIKRG